MGKFEDFLERTGFLNPDDPDDLIDEIEGKKQDPKAKRPITVGTNIPATAPTATPNSGTPTETAQMSTNIIEQAYLNVPKETEEVYLAEQLANNFKMLPANQLPDVIRNTLTTMGKNVETMQQAVITRQEALQQAFANWTAKTQEENDNLAAIIAECEEKIRICKQGQLDKQNALAQASTEANAENARLTNIYKLLGGQ